MVTRWKFRNGSTVCFNFSAYPLFGVFQTRFSTGPTSRASQLQELPGDPLVEQDVCARRCGCGSTRCRASASDELTVSQRSAVNGTLTVGMKSSRERPLSVTLPVRR